VAPLSKQNVYISLVTGTFCGRIRLEMGGGAWCPEQRVAADVVEYLQIDLGRLNVITHVETQGRFGNGQVDECTHRYRCTHVDTRFFHCLIIHFQRTLTVEFRLLIMLCFLVLLRVLITVTLLLS